MTSEVTCGIFLIFFTETSLIAGGTLVRAEETPSKKCINGDVCTLKDEETLRFLIIGDTGGMPFYPYTTYGQSSTATFLGDVASMKKTHFQIALGDNFYFTGVTDVYDERFESSFEDVYTADALQTPWYIMAGNHDHFGNVAAQIAYSNHSQRWVFPASYYTVSYRFGKRNTTVDFIIIDTIVLCGNTRDVVNGDLIDLALAESIDNPNNPSDPEAARVQWRWIEEQLSKSRANYLFVAGHYPVYSVSSHGPSDCLLERLQPLLRKYRVSAYLSGHDHTLQHLVEYYIPENVSKKNEATRKIPLHYIVSGMGSRADNSLKHLGSVPPGSLLFNRPDGFNPLSQLGLTSGGFVYCEASWEFIRVAYHVGSADSIYTFRIYPRHEPFDLHSKTILLSTFGDIPFGRTDSNDRKTINFAETEADKKTKNNDSLLMSDHPSEGINHKHSDKAYQILNDSLMWSNIRNDMFRGYRFELEMGENLELIIEPETSEIELANGTDRTHMNDDVMLLELEIDQTTDRNVNDSWLSVEFTIDDRSKNETSKVNTSIKSSSVGSPLAFNGSRIRTPIDEAPTTAEVITGHPTIEGASSTDYPLILDDGSHEIKESITNPLELLIETEPDITLSLVVDPIDEQPSDTGKVDSPDEILLQVETDAVNQLVTEGVSSSDHFSNIDANVSLEPPDDTHSLARFTPVNEDIHSRSNAKIETGVDVPRRHMLNLENTEDAIRSDKKNVEFPTIETLPDLMLEIV